METGMEQTENFSYEKALQELDEIVSKLEGEGLSLDETVVLYQRGRELAQYCQHLLDTVELRVQQVSEAEDGTTRVEPFPLEGNSP